MTRGKDFDLQERLIDYAVRIIKLYKCRNSKEEKKMIVTSLLEYWEFLVGYWLLIFFKGEVQC